MIFKEIFLNQETSKIDIRQIDINQLNNSSKKLIKAYSAII